MPDIELDVAIVGGGPAGAAMGCYLAKAGVRCAIFESETFPRAHVGESLVPSSTRVFKDLDFLSVMEEAGFPHKHGAVWTATGNANLYDHDWEGLEPDCHADIQFKERHQPGVEQNYTYHVDRGEFDHLLLRHAEKLGAAVHQGTRIKSVDFDDEGVTLHYERNREANSVRGGMVVDASGRNTFLGNQLKLKTADPVFDQFALHAWFEGLDRAAASKSDDYANHIYIHFLPISNSWIWQIPINDDATSVGVVTQKKQFQAAAKTDDGYDKFFWECVASRPELERALRNAKQLRPLRAEGDYSYAMDQICGDRWVMIGDAARFVDPIFSTGVSIALNSARFASDDIIAAVKADDFRKERFAGYEEIIRLGTHNWYEFISVYYRLNVLFTAFINDDRYRLDVLKLLQGDVYDDAEPAVLKKMREIVTEVETNKAHPWHKLLGDLTAKTVCPGY